MKALVIGIILLIGGLPGGRESAGAPAPDDTKNSASRGKGWLGVSIRDMTPRLAASMETSAESGALVTDVMDESPADDAGIREDDIITELNGKKVKDADDLREAVRSLAPGTTATVKARRKDAEKTFQVTVGRAPRSASRVAPPAIPLPPQVFRFETGNLMGLTLRTLNEQLGTYFQAPDGRGVLVEEVEEESSAEKAGFKAGDVITRAGDETVEEVRDVRRALRNADEGERVTFDILRHGSAQKITMTVEEERHGRSYRYKFRSDTDPEWRDFDFFDGDNHLLELELDRLGPDMDNLHDHLKTLRLRLHRLQDDRS